MIIKFLLLIFIAFALIKVIMRIFLREIARFEGFFWILFWILGGVFVYDPGLTVKVANALGVGRGADLVFYVSILLLFYLAFRIFVRLEKIDRTITKIVRDAALWQHSLSSSASARPNDAFAQPVQQRADKKL